jgi:hypothetical protein
LSCPTDRNAEIDPQGRPRRFPVELDRTPDVVYESLDSFGVAHRNRRVTKPDPTYACR